MSITNPFPPNILTNSILDRFVLQSFVPFQCDFFLLLAFCLFSVDFSAFFSSALCGCRPFWCGLLVYSIFQWNVWCDCCAPFECCHFGHFESCKMHSIRFWNHSCDKRLSELRHDFSLFFCFETRPSTLLLIQNVANCKERVCVWLKINLNNQAQTKVINI